CKRQYVVGVVRSCCDVQEEDEMNSHLGDGKNGETQRYAGCPDQRRVGDPEGCRGEDDREKQSGRINQELGRSPRLCLVESAVSGCAIVPFLSHGLIPIRYTTVNNPTQMMSSACQNRAKHSKRRCTFAANPLISTCAIITASQLRP